MGMLYMLFGVPDDAEARQVQFRRLTFLLIILLVLLSPAAHALTDHGMPLTARWFLAVGAPVFAVAFYVFVIMQPSVPALRPVLRVAIPLIVALALGLFLVGGQNWLACLAVGAAAGGRFGRSPWPAVASSVACAAAGFYIAVADSLGLGTTFAYVIIGPMAAFFAYNAGRRAEAVAALRRTRADLARTAVAEERLRIARDVHDLLGHSLSLITLKAELAGRVIGTDPRRAAAEIAELESVARQSLSDVRAAVAGYRQPDLAAELDSARQLLNSAGIASQITAAGTGGLPADVDAALAWAVREGTTNVVRHSRATHVAISVTGSPAMATAEISDNGPPADGEPAARVRHPADQVRPAGQDGQGRVRPGGSGLAGLAERIHSLGGELMAGTAAPQGFRLRVMVPLGAQS
jgi:two-component system, NarL family, sensor histidine kinase DesK